MAYPFTVLQTRTAIFKQMVYQCFHRIGAGLFKNRAGPGKPNAYDKEVTRIFETMAWIDFFINQERLTLASACVCRTIHLDYTGQWDQALVQYERAANLYEKIGHIKK